MTTAITVRATTIEVACGDLSAQSDVEALCLFVNRWLIPVGAAAQRVHHSAGQRLAALCKTLSQVDREEVVLTDRFANLGVELLQAAAREMARAVGDGTTTTIVLTQALARSAAKAIALGFDPVALRQGIETGVAAADRHIAGRSRSLENGRDLPGVALTACPADEEIAALVVAALRLVGSEGAILIEAGPHVDTGVDIVEGMRLEQGALASQVETYIEHEQSELTAGRVLAMDSDVTSVTQIVPALEYSPNEARDFCHPGGFWRTIRVRARAAKMASSPSEEDATGRDPKLSGAQAGGAERRDGAHSCARIQ